MPLTSVHLLTNNKNILFKFVSKSQTTKQVIHEPTNANKFVVAYYVANHVSITADHHTIIYNNQIMT